MVYKLSKEERESERGQGKMDGLREQGHTEVNKPEQKREKEEEKGC